MPEQKEPKIYFTNMRPNEDFSPIIEHLGRYGHVVPIDHEEKSQLFYKMLFHCMQANFIVAEITPSKNYDLVQRIVEKNLCKARKPTLYLFQADEIGSSVIESYRKIGEEYKTFDEAKKAIDDFFGFFSDLKPLVR